LKIQTAVTFVVEDQGGNPIPNSIIEFSRLDPVEEFGIYSTKADGSLNFQNFVSPIIGANYELIVTPPNTIYALPVIDTVFIGCNDTRVVIKLEIIEEISCGDYLSGESSFNLCIGETDSLFSATICHNCPSDVNYTLSDLNISGLETKLINTSTNTYLGNNGTIPAGECFKIELVFSPTESVNVIDSLIFEAQSAEGTTRFSLLVEAVAVSCSECECPSYPNEIRMSDIDTVCIGESKDIEIDMSSVINDSDPDLNCSMNFERIRNFRLFPELRIVSGPSSLPGGGSALENMTVAFTPKDRKLYADTAIYKVSIIDSDGKEKECDTLSIVFVGYGGDSECMIVDNQSDQRLITTDSLIQNCVSLDRETKILMIRNNGECPLDIDVRTEHHYSSIWG